MHVYIHTHTSDLNIPPAGELSSENYILKTIKPALNRYLAAELYSRRQG